jgi:hypothetical protein
MLTGMYCHTQTPPFCCTTFNRYYISAVEALEVLNKISNAVIFPAIVELTLQKIKFAYPTNLRYYRLTLSFHYSFIS